jgi:hypothetical protein
MLWKVYLDFVPPTTCERCGGPFAFGQYPAVDGRRYSESRLGDKRAKWERDIICNVCYVADEIENYLERKTYHYLPGNIGQTPALKRLIEVAPVYKDKWNECVELHHEYRKRLGKV